MKSSYQTDYVLVDMDKNHHDDSTIKQSGGTADGVGGKGDDNHYIQAGVIPVWAKILVMLCIFLFVLKDSNITPHDDKTLSSIMMKKQNMLLSVSSPSSLLQHPDTDEEEALDISVIGDPISVWASIDTLHRCKHIDVPDIPTRAYVDSKGIVHMIQGSTSFHKMTGPSLFDVHRECDAIWNKTANPDPSQFAANEFLDSPIAFGNGTAIALAHTEYPGDNYNNCPGPNYPYCWTVTMGLMISYDFGNTWQHAKPPPHHLVAAVPYQYNRSQLASGWGDPTNILKNPKDDYYYVAAWNRNDVGLQSAGVCMMRTNSLLDPSSWRAWNGSHYSVTFVSPYNTPSDFNPANHICTVLEMDSSILDPTHCNPFGLVYSQPMDIFLMTWSCLNGYGPIYMTTSTNLIDWSTPQPFYNRSTLPNATKHNVTSMHYPNLMDATAPKEFDDANYGIIGDNPHLFWVSFGHNVYVDGRSAWATPLHLQRGGRKGNNHVKGAIL